MIADVSSPIEVPDRESIHAFHAAALKTGVRGSREAA